MARGGVDKKESLISSHKTTRLDTIFFSIMVPPKKLHVIINHCSAVRVGVLFAGWETQTSSF